MNPNKKLKKMPSTMTSTMTQLKLFNAMLSNNNYDFLEEACRLLVRTEKMKDLPIIHAHNKLLQKIVTASEKQSIVKTYIYQYRLKYI